MTHPTLKPPTFFTFGCMSLGTDLLKLDEHIRIARTAMDAGVWFHASPTYNRGFTYMVLRMAFDEARSKVPPMIIKIRCGTPKLMRFEVEDALGRMKLDRIDVAQLVFTETGGYKPVTDDFARNGPIAAECEQLRREGKVSQFCPQVEVNCSQAFLPLAERGVFDGFVLYLNPLQRDADDAMWNHLQTQGTPLWALRTVAGAAGEPARLEKRRKETPDDANLRKIERLAAIAAEVGCDWTAFCMRYAASVLGLKTTIGGTGDLSHLNHFLSASNAAKPLPPDVMAVIDAARRG
jgi:aryl-alcohol dehydrogenase-like predicted oxidoreductase